MRRFTLLLVAVCLAGCHSPTYCEWDTVAVIPIQGTADTAVMYRLAGSKCRIPPKPQ